MKQDFIFDGKYGSDFNLVIANITNDNSTDTSVISKTEFSTFKPSNMNKQYFTGSNESEVLSTTFQTICLKNCNVVEFDEILIEQITKWMCRDDGYHRFAFINDNEEIIEYNAKIDINKIKYGTRIIGLEFSVETDSQVGYTKKKIMKTLSTNESFVINDNSSKNGSCFIDMTIKCGISGDFMMTSEFNNKKRIITINNCKQDEIITFTNMCTIDSSISYRIIGDDFNYVFPKIFSNVNTSTNTFTVNMPCIVTAEYELRRKVGI